MHTRSFERNELKVSIVIPTYNRRNDVLECIESLQNLSYPNYEIVVVDNASIDGTSEAIRQQFPDVKLITNKRNLGVTGGQNLGAEHSSGDFFLFLDHDTIADKQFLSELVTVMQSDREIGMAGPIIYYYDDPQRVWGAGTSINLLTGKVSFNASDQIDRGQFKRMIEVQVLPIGYMTRREVIEKVGLFDDVYFAVYEDTDFSLRVRKAGYKVVCVTTSKVWHKIPYDTRMSAARVLSKGYYVARNRIIFMRRHAKLLNFVVFFFIFLPAYFVNYTIQSLRLGRIDFLQAFWRGAASGINFVAKGTEAMRAQPKAGIVFQK